MSLLTTRPTLYVDQSLESKRIRALLGEKGNPVEVVELTPDLAFKLEEINVDGKYPFMADRGLVLFGAALDEYIHERWPGPQLLPHEPMQRGQARMLAGWIREWYDLDGFAKTKHLREVESVFDPTHKFFFGTQLSIVDIALIPLLRSFNYRPLTRAFAQYIERLEALDGYKVAA